MEQQEFAGVAIAMCLVMCYVLSVALYIIYDMLKTARQESAYWHRAYCKLALHLDPYEDEPHEAPHLPQ